MVGTWRGRLRVYTAVPTHAPAPAAIGGAICFRCNLCREQFIWWGNWILTLEKARLGDPVALSHAAVGQEFVQARSSRRYLVVDIGVESCFADFEARPSGDEVDMPALVEIGMAVH